MDILSCFASKKLLKQTLMSNSELCDLLLKQYNYLDLADVIFIDEES